MTKTGSASPNRIRAAFSAAMSAMYRKEVPAYGTLMTLVADVNQQALQRDPILEGRLQRTGELSRVSEERHGAIRLGTPAELSTMRRLFAAMGMEPVGYYDLTEAGVPVHSTAFRPIGEDALRRNPFRVFTSLLRLDLIEDPGLRHEAQVLLDARRIFTDRCLALIERSETQGGLNEDEAAEFVREALETFRWHSDALVGPDLYQRLHDAHRLVADVVSFRGPHINHLTPRTLDIDAVQELMPRRGISPKAVVEGPPTRKCPILLRQTSFKALDEAVSFDGHKGQHTARFGEIEARGQALTPKGRALYDRLLTQARDQVRPKADGSNAADYIEALRQSFTGFPDDLDAIRREGLGYFEFSLTEKANSLGDSVIDMDVEALIAAGCLRADPITYEDFLPVSAAGIFQSNLGDDAAQDFQASPNRDRFEADLGAKVQDEFELYQSLQDGSLSRCLSTLGRSDIAAQ
ncbi:2-oxoadipate dioxygenase/decarboxylase HglS [Paracoccus benzoatiresistens]|uniref:2-oxoadipate dioxygenase/decarboxylase n=1 Tax=Paracoccus benzoatiresistens TaxID=2997341 RepID=A0ABT4J8D2_9RHOB|nr:VOC family protein [Paracoccus sp. EF6]MCZ0963370.1 VOC family protein [Paracoccus sp. EF6]